ncbi:uncharacterized protein LOC141686241 [Apium graveolens]|uniref:uncharacterized protein LOC141686241 n=1 Tax=Apium graveolens TaxID=4045 RepID=UPI003D79C89E
MEIQDQLLCLMIMYCYLRKLRPRNVPRIRDNNSALPGFAFTLELLEGSNTQCQEMMRLSRVAYIQLCKHFKQRGWLEDSRYSTVEEKMAIFLHGAVGALDGTLVHAVIPVGQQARYRGRGRDKYYLCDAAYTNTRGYLIPYRNTRYWLADFNRQRALTKEEKFNHAHAKLRNVIERAYGVLKARFPILKRMAPYSLSTQLDIVISCIVVHNFIRKKKLEDELFDWCDQTSDGE